MTEHTSKILNIDDEALEAPTQQTGPSFCGGARNFCRGVSDEALDAPTQQAGFCGRFACQACRVSDEALETAEPINAAACGTNFVCFICIVSDEALDTPEQHAGPGNCSSCNKGICFCTVSDETHATV